MNIFYEFYKDYFPADVPNMHDDLTGKPFAQQLWVTDPNNGTQGGPNASRNPEGVRRHMAAGSFVDMLIGEVTEVLDELAPEALLLYTADHGDLATNHRLKGKGSVMYDENVRIPLLLRWPGCETPGSEPMIISI